MNIDRQIANDLIAQRLTIESIKLSDLDGESNYLQREVVLQYSCFYFYFETDTQKKGFVAMKDMTFENQTIGVFPRTFRQGMK